MKKMKINRITKGYLKQKKYLQIGGDKKRSKRIIETSIQDFDNL